MVQRLLKVKIEKWVIWIALVGVLLLLRHLLPVIFLTFVLSYIGNSLVSRISGRWPGGRRLQVAVVYVLFLLILAGAAVLIVPRMFSEARQLAVFYLSRDSEEPPRLPAQLGRQLNTPEESQTRRYVDAVFEKMFGGRTYAGFARSDAYQDVLTRVEEFIQGFVPQVVERVKEFVNASISVTFQFLLAIILSFLILWDFPALQRSVRSLATGRSADVYAEIAPSMRAFGTMLGRAFEAQTGIALVNALLTSIGFLILGIPSIALLATIVFFCSYIPVVGVILSTIPAALFAFKAGGVGLVGWLVVMVLIVHAIEAYALNPLIYGHHLKLHPVAILAVLLVGEHLFGIWGLLLGVPIAAFVWIYVVRGAPVEPITETAVAPVDTKTDAVSTS